MPQHELKAASKVNWNVNVIEVGGYPGDENVKIGCLQRIANATEAMAANYLKLQGDLEYYKRLYKEECKSVERLVRSNNALRGHLKRLKKAK